MWNYKRRRKRRRRKKQKLKKKKKRRSWRRERKMARTMTGFEIRLNENSAGNETSHLENIKHKGHENPNARG